MANIERRVFIESAVEGIKQRAEYLLYSAHPMVNAVRHNFGTVLLTTALAGVIGLGAAAASDGDALDKVGQVLDTIFSSSPDISATTPARSPVNPVFPKFN